jgi:hypothetical protein
MEALQWTTTVVIVVGRERLLCIRRQSAFGYYGNDHCDGQFRGATVS